MADEYGSIVNVATTNVGEFLTADVATGSAVLPVSDASTFDEAGGQLSLNGAVYPYTAIDTEANLIFLRTGGGLLLTLGNGISVPALADDRVEIYPPRPEKKALIDFGVEEGEAVYAIVPHDLQAVIPDGFREEGYREPVLVEERRIGELYVKDVSATQPDLTGSVEIQLGDGTPPIASPTPVVMGWVGALHVKWAAIISPDVVTYDVHISTVSDFTPNDATTLVGSTAGTTFTIRSLPNDLLLAYSTTYYVKIVARDYDGAAPAGDQGSDQLQPVTGPDISAAFVYAGEINAAQINGGDITADLTLSGSIKTALSGGRTEIIGGQINIYDPLGQPGIVLAPEGSVFRGDAEIGGLTVTEAMSIRGTANEISTGAEIQLASGITAPSTGPSVVQDWESITFTKTGDATFNPANLTSITKVGTLWVCGYRDGSEYRVYRFNADGTYNSLGADAITSDTALQTTQIVADGLCFTVASNNTILRHKAMAANYSFIFEDEFTASINGTNWPYQSGPPVWDSGTASAKLTGDMYLGSIADKDMKGSSVQAKLTRISGTDGQDLFMTVRDHSTGNRRAQMKLSGTTLEFFVFNSSDTLDFSSSVTYNPTTHQYWKIAEVDAVSGGDFYFYTSQDGINWTQRYTADHDFSVGELSDLELRFTTQEDEPSSGTIVVYVDEVRYGLHNVSISRSYTPLGSDTPFTIGNDGTNLLLAEHRNDSGADRLRVHTIDPVTMDILSTYESADESTWDGPLSGILKGSFDFGASRYVTKRSTGTGDWRVVSTTGGSSRDTTAEFPPVGVVKSIGWDGSNFWELSTTGTLYKHTAATLAGSYLAAYTWYDSNATGGTHETTVSPTSSFTLKRRARITLTAAAIPGAGGTDDPNSVRFYVGTSAGALKLQSTTGAGVNSAIYQAITTGGAAPPGSNNFVAGVAARLRNAAASLDIKGDGTIKGTNVQVTGILTAANRIVGSVSITPSAANTPTSLSVTFPQALTGTTFYGVCTPGTTVPGTTVTGVGIDQITSTGCRIWLTRTNTTATTIFFMVEGV